MLTYQEFLKEKMKPVPEELKGKKKEFERKMKVAGTRPKAADV